MRAEAGDPVARALASLPGAQRVPSRHLELILCRRFLDPESCARLIDLIDANRRPSTIADANGDPLYRTSETCDLDPADPVVAGVAARLAAAGGLDPAHGEPMQGQRYAPGQQFKAHTDYFEPDGPDYVRNCARTGQRTWTLMVYLNQPVAGGATRFTRLGKIIQPETGKLVAWCNLDREGRPNEWTMHHGMKVRAGLKYIITQWYRERPWPTARTS